MLYKKVLFQVYLALPSTFPLSNREANLESNHLVTDCDEKRLTHLATRQTLNGYCQCLRFVTSLTEVEIYISKNRYFINYNACVLSYKDSGLDCFLSGKNFCLPFLAPSPGRLHHFFAWEINSFQYFNINLILIVNTEYLSNIDI